MESTDMKKHAYLIMAHTQPELLKKLLQMLDDERNDIYLHIDKKVKNFDFDKFKNIAKKSKIIIRTVQDVLYQVQLHQIWQKVSLLKNQ